MNATRPSIAALPLVISASGRKGPNVSFRLAPVSIGIRLATEKMTKVRAMGTTEESSCCRRGAPLFSSAAMAAVNPSMAYNKGHIVTEELNHVLFSGKADRQTIDAKVLLNSWLESQVHGSLHHKMYIN